MVTLMPDCKTDTGKWGEGMLVSHSRKLPCNSESASVRNLATSFSSSGIHDLTRWQFCRQTQCPAGVQEEEEVYKRTKKTKSLSQLTRPAASANDIVSFSKSDRLPITWCMFPWGLLAYIEQCWRCQPLTYIRTMMSMKYQPGDVICTRHVLNLCCMLACLLSILCSLSVMASAVQHVQLRPNCAC